MTFRDEVTALYEALDLPPRGTLVVATVPVGNGISQFQTIESDVGAMVRTMEERLGIALNRKVPLGARFRAVRNALSPLAKVLDGKAQLILFGGHYSQELCQMHADVLFVFGDNCIRQGRGGQAIIRPEPNARGVATKRLPGGKDEFFVEGNLADMGTVVSDLYAIETAIKAGKRVVLPITKEGRISLGCGLAALPYHAPTVYALIERWFDKIKKEHRHVQL